MKWWDYLFVLNYFLSNRQFLGCWKIFYLFFVLLILIYTFISQYFVCKLTKTILAYYLLSYMSLLYFCHILYDEFYLISKYKGKVSYFILLGVNYMVLIKENKSKLWLDSENLKLYFHLKVIYQLWYKNTWWALNCFSLSLLFFGWNWILGWLVWILLLFFSLNYWVSNCLKQEDLISFA